MENPSIANILLSFLRLGFSAFGGTAIVFYIKELVVEKNKWLDAETFNDGVALSQSLPGATAVQVATYVGLKLQGIKGAGAACLAFCFPAFLLMFLLSYAYIRFQNLPFVVSLFSGLNLIAVAIIANAVYGFGRETLKSRKDLLIALASLIFLYIGVSPFLVIFGAALLGIFIYKDILPHKNVGLIKNGVFHVKHTIILVLIFALFLFALYVFNDGLFELCGVLSKISLFSFGGGFAALPLMLHEIVQTRGWLDHKTFLDGISLGQITPGPVIITATFIGYILYGFLGATLGTFSIFAPSYILLIATAPLSDRIKASLFYSRAANAVVITFVGLLAFVALKLSLSIHWGATKGLFALLAFFLLLKRVDILYVVVGASIVSIFIFS